MSKPSIGYVGLGLMGAAMVSRMQDKGYSLQVLGNRNRAGLDAAVARGAVEAESARALAESSDVIMLCMTTSDAVESRMLGDDGVIAGLSEGKIVIDFGTSLPESTKRLAAEAAAKGAAMLDAPLGRTPSHALEGKLNIMCAGDKDVFDRMQPVFRDIAENIFHLGPSGAGHTIKLINNFISMSMANALSEAFAVAGKAGVSGKDVYSVMSAGPVHSSIMDFIAAYVLENNPDNMQFSVENGLKDISYYTRMAAGLGYDSVIAAPAVAAMTAAVESGAGGKYIPQMFDHYMKTVNADK